MIIMIRRMTAFALTAVMMAGMFLMIPVDPAFAAAKKPAKVKGLTLKLSGNTVRASWKKAKNAKKYQVYVKDSASSWTLKKTLKKTTYSMNGAHGTAYSFKVRGINGKKKGAFSAVRTITIPEEKPEEPEEEIDGEITILEEPDIQSAADGTEATFTVRAEGKNLKYQWFISTTESNLAGKRIDGATESTYKVTASPLTKDTFYYCVISNNSSSYRTKAAQLDVVLGNHIYITSQPEPVTIYEGLEVVFTVETVGTGESLYQWYRNDKPSTEGATRVEGATDHRLAFEARLEKDDTYYYCKVRDDISFKISDIVKLDVEINPARTALVKDIRALIDKNGVLSTETIEVDGHNYYVLAEEDDMALLLAKEPWNRNDHLVPGMEMWGLDQDNLIGNTRYMLNTQYLPSLPTLKYMAKEVTNITHSFTETDDYYETDEKVFVLTEADVTGSYSRIKGVTIPDDFSFNKTEEHIGKALPLEIAQLRDEEGNLALWWVRSPESTGHFWWDDTRLYTEPAWVSYNDDGSIAMTKYVDGGWCPYIRPALWVDLSIE